MIECFLNSSGFVHLQWRDVSLGFLHTCNPEFRMDSHKKLMHELKAVKLEAQQYIGVFLVLESIKKNNSKLLFF